MLTAFWQRKIVKLSAISTRFSLLHKWSQLTNYFFQLSHCVTFCNIRSFCADFGIRISTFQLSFSSKDLVIDLVPKQNRSSIGFKKFKNVSQRRCRPITQINLSKRDKLFGRRREYAEDRRQLRNCSLKRIISVSCERRRLTNFRD